MLLLYYRYYIRGKDGQLTNTPYVDNSYKWAGGGYLSTVEDLVSFGNALLLSYNEHQRRKKRGNDIQEEILQHSHSSQYKYYLALLHNR